MRASEVVIGSGSPGPGPVLKPALKLASSGLVNYLVFDRLGGQFAQLELARQGNPNVGHDPNTGRVAQAFAPHLAEGVKIIGSFGAANVASGVAAAVDGIRQAGIRGLRVAGIHGENVRDLVLKHDIHFPMLGRTASELGDGLLTAHAYIGAEPVRTALEGGAHFVLGGRICDASLAVGALCHELGWSLDDWDNLAYGTLVGHLLTGGFGPVGGGFADPPHRIVPGIEDLGLPMARVSDKAFIISKLPSAGGLVSREVLKCRISYEIQDPSAYLTPDVTADFSMTSLKEVGNNEVKVAGLSGRPRPKELLVLASIDWGWIGEAEVSFGGPGCLNRARLAEEISRKRLEMLGSEVEEVWVEYGGIDALHHGNYKGGEPADIRIRIAARTRSPEGAEEVRQLASRLYWGPAGTAAMRDGVRRAIKSTSAFLPRDLVPLDMEVVDV